MAGIQCDFSTQLHWEKTRLLCVGSRAEFVGVCWALPLDEFAFGVEARIRRERWESSASCPCDAGHRAVPLLLPSSLARLLFLQQHHRNLIIKVFQGVLSAGFTVFLVPYYITAPHFLENKVWVGIACYLQEKMMIN